MKTIGQQINWNFETNGDLVIKDKNDKPIYFENLKGNWAKWQYDSKNKEIYYEDLNGVIIDNRHKASTELTLESLAEQVSKLTEIVTRFVKA